MIRVLLVCICAIFAPALVRAGDKTDLAQQAKAILQKHCANCHGGGTAVKGGFGFVLDRDLLVNRLLIMPGKANQSDLFMRVQLNEMPPKSAKSRPTPAEVKTLESWLNAGAAPFDAPAKATKVLSPPEVVEAILADLGKLEPRQHRFTRYLTLSHLAMAGRSSKDVDTTREAAGKLVNSLSWHPRITKPEAVDADATILRIDLRAYKWTATQWERLVSAYPYRLQSNAESKALAALTGSEFPALRADWFVATAARPPFYHDLLQLPTGEKALERLLHVDVQADIQDDNVQRTGFNDSGVSKNNRMLERHDSAYGVFWRSYDFANNRGRQNLFEHPLGPNTGATSFQPAGGEMIFHLPNGLQAYMLVDAKGKRIEKGPIEIVADPRRPDQKVETGISCMSCHARGLLFKADQVRDHVEKNANVFGKSIVDAIRATHPRKARLQAQIEQDNVRYVKALENFGVRDPDQEPVNLVTTRFESTIDGVTAAAELGFHFEQLSVYLKQNPDQARLFGSLLVKGGTTQRAVFEERFRDFAANVQALRALQGSVTKIKVEPSFEGHTATVNAIAFSSDGFQAASASDDKTIRLWHVPSGRSLGTLESAAEAYAVAYSTDRKFLVTGGRDRLVRVWDLQKREAVRVFKGHTDGIRAVAFSRDGKRAVSAGDDRTLRIWDLTGRDEPIDMVGHTSAITSVAWSRDGATILSGSRDGTVRWWNVAKHQIVSTLEGHSGAVLCVALSPDGKWALSGGNDKTVRLWSLPQKKELHAFTGHQNAVIQVAFDSSGKEVFSSSSQHRSQQEPTFRRWDAVGHKELGTLKAGADDSFGCAAISPDGRHVLVGGPGGFLRLRSW